MILCLTAKTDIPEMVIDFIEVKLQSGQTVSLTWDESESGVINGIFTGRYKGVYFDEDYTNGKIKELKNLQIQHIEIYSESEKGCNFELTELFFSDGLENLILKNPEYQTERGKSHTNWQYPVFKNGIRLQTELA